MTRREHMPPEQNPRQAAPNLRGVDECLSVARQLLGVIQDETKALKAFDTDQLLQLVTQKEALIRDLGGKLTKLKSRAGEVQGTVDTQQKGAPAGDSAAKANGSDIVDKRSMLREVLTEIERGNEINRIFIQGSLSFGSEILELFVPGTYTVGQEGQAERLSPGSKGLALNKEV